MISMMVVGIGHDFDDFGELVMRGVGGFKN